MKKTKLSRPAYTIRKIELSDAEAFLNLRERNDTVEQTTKKINVILESKGQTAFVAEQDGALIGFILIYGRQMRIYAKTRTIAIAILKKHWGKGIGNDLVRTAIDWAKKQKLHRLELEAWSANNSAIRLYKKHGFKIEGTKKDGVIIGKEYTDVVVMGLVL